VGEFKIAVGLPLIQTPKPIIPGLADFVDSPSVSSVCEERDSLSWSIMIGLARLSGLLLRTTRVQLENGTSLQIDALLAERKSIAAKLEALLTR
jgi:hypothetical protein